MLFNVPVNGTNVVNGSCEKDSQSITVQWGHTSKMMLQFTANDSASEFMLSQMYLSINISDEFADAKGNFVICFTAVYLLFLCFDKCSDIIVNFLMKQYFFGMCLLVSKIMFSRRDPILYQFQ